MGCPCSCSFCNQHRITGTIHLPNEKDIEKAVIIAAKNQGDNLKNTQLAFFGGSFTAIDKKYMMRLLITGARLVNEYGLMGIRVSTRPDAINKEIIEALEENCVTAVELGAQSMSNKVLSLNNRGHSAECTKNAAELISKSKMELGLQMMTGLYGSTHADDLRTAVEIRRLSPKTVRIYPTIVLEDTQLCNLYRQGVYLPQSLEEAVDGCAELIELFYNKNIKVIRVGLHSSDEINQNAVAGPYHPAFMELCQSKIFLNKLVKSLKKTSTAIVSVNPKQLSQALGQKRQNIDKLKKMGYNVRIIPNNSVEFGEISID